MVEWWQSHMLNLLVTCTISHLEYLLNGRVGPDQLTHIKSQSLKNHNSFSICLISNF